MQWLKNHSLFKNSVILLLFLIMMGFCMFALFKLKTDSATGRILIWKVTDAMITEHPITGVGFDRFKSFYMTEQATYFELATDSQETMVAGDVNYAFNDFYSIPQKMA